MSTKKTFTKAQAILRKQGVFMVWRKSRGLVACAANNGRQAMLPMNAIVEEIIRRMS